jgi:hypothetical protein
LFDPEDENLKNLIGSLCVPKTVRIVRALVDPENKKSEEFDWLSLRPGEKSGNRMVGDPEFFQRILQILSFKDFAPDKR